jgi:cell volume regulation protein A
VPSIHTVEQLALLLSVVALAALALEPVLQRLDLPAPLVFLGGGLVLGSVWDSAHEAIDPGAIGGLGSIALVLILVDGGLRLGVRSFRRELGPILVLGIPGTAVTFALVALAMHGLLDRSWTESLIVGAVLSPTDPAAVFSVLASRGLSSRRVPAVLEGEAGVNDPVAIALTLSLVDAAGDGSGPSVSGVLGDMLQQGVIGALVGVAAGVVVAWLLDLRTPSLTRAPGLAVLAGGFAAFGAASLLDGSGFLAAYLYGLILGDRERLEGRRAVMGLHGDLSSLAEIGMFVLLGVSLTRVSLSGELADAVLLAALLILVFRPVVAFAPLRAFRFSRAEAAFGVWGGLKGAVPILLGSLPMAADLRYGPRVFAITGVVVFVSLVVQGATLGRVASALGLERAPP